MRTKDARHTIPNMLPDLAVAPNRRFLQLADGRPFFYLADTAWELFHRLTREEASLYLRTRAAQGFNVIQAVALAEFDGLRVPNAYGVLPLHGEDPTRPNEAYFQHVDWIVGHAASLGLRRALLPTWGDKWHQAHGAGPEIFNPDNAHAYGDHLGRRYREQPIIWVLGGDRGANTDAHRATIRAMAAGLTHGDGGRHLKTFHPRGSASSATPFHAESWLDFNMLQSGHQGRDVANGETIAADYALAPAKPCLDGEPCYEDHPVMDESWVPLPGEWFDDNDVRRAAYRAVFAGACGHTYGCHDVWQMYHPGRTAKNQARTPWQEALHLPGAGQMQHLRALIESRPYFSRVPDPALASGTHTHGGLAVTRGADDDYAMIYLPTGQPVTVQMERLGGGTMRAAWFDPRDGTCREVGMISGRDAQTFTPPASGSDWVLTLDRVEG